MSQIEENSEIPEMNILRHKHDLVVQEHGFNYTDNLFKRTLSKILYNNTNVESFLNQLNNMMVTIIDSSLPIRNLFFYSHNKYYNKHGR